MIATIVISSLTIVSLVTTVLVKPYVKIGKANVGLYWVVCLVGALLIVACGGIPLSKVVQGITQNSSVNPLKILTLFICMTMISVFLGDAGFFDLVAEKVFLKTKGAKIKLFVILYAVVAVLTVFTSNDIIILTFTPPICIFAKKAKISPLPYLMAEFVAANTFSLFLVVGNPTNIYLAAAQGITFWQYFCYMALPALACGLGAFGGTLLLFGKQLKGNLLLEPAANANEHRPTPPLRKALLFVDLAHLVVCIVMLAISDLVGVEMYVVCVALFASLLVFNVIFELATERKIKRTALTLLKAPFELIPFVLSMFVIVLALSHNGITATIGNALVTGTKWDGVIFGLISSLAANLLNNIPMSVLFEQIVGANSLHALLGVVVGSNVGAIITPLGALAGIMWSKILKEQGAPISFLQFSKYGLPIALLSLAPGLLCLLLV